MAKKNNQKEEAATAVAETTAPLARGEGWAKATALYEVPVALARFWWRGEFYNMLAITKAQLRTLEAAQVIQKRAPENAEA
jgi:hypothetical protein